MQSSAYHLTDGKWANGLDADGYVHHAVGNQSSFTRALHSGQLNENGDVPEHSRQKRMGEEMSSKY